jgi:hypothetical protein
VVVVVRFVCVCRFRLRYLPVGPYEITVRQSGFEDAVRHLAVVVGAAFELPVPLSVSRIDANVTVIADATVLEAARSQIAATVSEAEVRSLSMNGRNFLELALLAPGVDAQHLALPTARFERSDDAIVHRGPCELVLR